MSGGSHTAASQRAMDLAGGFDEPKSYGTSIFDPVLCELAYSWFCPAGGVVLDPFAGGSVRGIVASRLGHPYVGVELSGQQVDENRRQAAEICASEPTTAGDAAGAPAGHVDAIADVTNAEALTPVERRGDVLVKPLDPHYEAKCVPHLEADDLLWVVGIRRSETGAAAAERVIVPPVWHEGDSRDIRALVGDVQADLVLSCPPYADLEVYSDHPADISNMDYPDFLAAYRTIIAETCSLLREDRFAVFVVGEARDRGGYLYGLIPDTVDAFRDAGLRYYNDAVLLTAIGSTPVRAAGMFRNRKLGRVHQNVLVFVKGDARRAAAACDPVRGLAELDAYGGADGA